MLQKYLINLEKRPDRLVKTTKNLHNKNYYDLIRFNAIEITKKLIAFKTVSPEDNGVMEFISNRLKELNFEQILVKNFTVKKY